MQKVCTTTKHDASPQREHRDLHTSLPFNDVRGMIAASPLPPDEYAMRIATKLNLLSSVKSTRPHSLSLQFRCSRHQRKRLLR
ncbi:hypothetical protein TNCV_3887311 [Trichonephila clavipes]|nr:hypothetical protein TNCV_3887311 [Trichonephila clavipes]